MHFLHRAVVVLMGSLRRATQILIWHVCRLGRHLSFQLIQTASSVDNQPTSIVAVVAGYSLLTLCA